MFHRRSSGRPLEWERCVHPRRRMPEASPVRAGSALAPWAANISSALSRAEEKARTGQQSTPSRRWEEPPCPLGPLCSDGAVSLWEPGSGELPAPCQGPAQCASEPVPGLQDLPPWDPLSPWHGPPTHARPVPNRSGASLGCAL